MRKIILPVLFLTILISCVSAMDITFFYSESCPYCQEIKPTIFDYAKQDYGNHWNLFDTSYPANRQAFLDYGFNSVPAFVIETDDGREIKWTGADLQRLGCELQEMSTMNCITYSADTCIKGSLFKW